jgi:hypothetical protein
MRPIFDEQPSSDTLASASSDAGADSGGRFLRSILSFVDKYPLLVVFGSAIILRLVAAFFSKGYMGSDDHFETVKIALQWLQNGSPFNSDGFLTWHTTPIGEITRFPLYNLSLYGIFVVERWLGLATLDQMMYGVRLLHVTFSLIAVWSVYRTVELVTKSRRWATLGGVIIASHFLLPFLSARNLIEMVGGNIWIVAIYFLYRWRETQLVEPHVHQPGSKAIFSLSANKLLFIAGIITGLAWMVRFQVALAVLPIPFVLYYQSRQLTSALWYSAGVSVMLLLAGIVDYALIGSFMGSTVNHLSQIQREGAMYQTSVFIYPAVITVFLIPPLAFVVYWLVSKREFFREHALLMVSAVSFVALHMVTENRQERYMIPIIPVLLLLVTLALWRRYSSRGYVLKRRVLFRGIVVITVVTNAVFLALFTVHYGHKGIVEPFALLAKLPHDTNSVRTLIISPSFGTLFPQEDAESVFEYPGENPDVESRSKIDVRTRFAFSWSEIAELRADSSWLDSVDYVLVYPGQESALSNTLDSLGASAERFKEMFHVEPSQIGRLLNWLNPRYNPTYEVWVYANE